MLKKKNKNFDKTRKIFSHVKSNAFHYFGDDSCVNTRRQNGKSKYNSEKGTLKYT